MNPTIAGSTRDADARSEESSVPALWTRLAREWKHLRDALSPTKRRERDRWLRQGGVELLRAVGIGTGDAVVDFGCGSGAYSLPAARLVGEGGRVAAVDVSARKLNKLMRQAAAGGLACLRTAQSLEAVTVLLGGRPCKAILLYDVLHFMDADARRRLYRAFHRMLARDGVLSVHPKHVRGDAPARRFRDMTIEDVVHEIEAAGYRLRDRREATLWHGHGCVRGTLLAFGKAAEAEPGPDQT